MFRIVITSVSMIVFISITDKTCLYSTSIRCRVWILILRMLKCSTARTVYSILFIIIDNHSAHKCEYLNILDNSEWLLYMIWSLQYTTKRTMEWLIPIMPEVSNRVAYDVARELNTYKGTLVTILCFMEEVSIITLIRFLDIQFR